MLVGILSDSHGRYPAVRQAMALFDRLGVQHVIHCGDVGDEDVFDELVGRPFTFVWGNTDYGSDGLKAYLETLGISPPVEVPTRLQLDGKRFAIFHGHERGFEAAVAGLEVDYLLHGHSHVPRNERLFGKRVINPGALHRVRQRTVATLDTEADTVTFHEIRQDQPPV